MSNYLKGIIIGGGTLLLALYYLIDPAGLSVFPQCVIYTTTGLFCPGCGSQRALHGMLHLNLEEVFHNNFLFFPAVLLIGYNYIHPSVNARFHTELPNIFYHKKTPWIILTVILLFWILRNLPFYPFTTLAPM